MAHSDFANARALSGAYTAAASLSAFTAVTLAGAVATGGSGTEGQVAFLIAEDYASGDSRVTLYSEGEGLAKVNGNSVNIAAGDWLKTTAGGVLIKAATDKDRVVAQALEASTADGDLIRVLLTRHTLSV